MWLVGVDLVQFFVYDARCNHRTMTLSRFRNTISPKYIFGKKIIETRSNKEHACMRLSNWRCQSLCANNLQCWMAIPYGFFVATFYSHAEKHRDLDCGCCKSQWNCTKRHEHTHKHTHTNCCMCVLFKSHINLSGFRDFGVMIFLISTLLWFTALQVSTAMADGAGSRKLEKFVSNLWCYWVPSSLRMVPVNG